MAIEEVEEMIEEIEFNKELCARNNQLMNPCHGIPLDRLFSILGKFIPEVNNYLTQNQLENESVYTTDNTRIMA